MMPVTIASTGISNRLFLGQSGLPQTIEIMFAIPLIPASGVLTE
jgi:hypothetical protein